MQSAAPSGGRTCGNAAQEAEGCSRLWGTRSSELEPAASTSNSGFGCGFSSHFLPSLPPPRGAGGRNNSGGVQRGMSELLFSRIAAFWDPGAAQVGHFRDLSRVCFPFLSLCGFKPQTIPHFSPSIPGACRYCHNKNHQLSAKFPIQSRQSLVPVTSASAAGTPGLAELLL